MNSSIKTDSKGLDQTGAGSSAPVPIEQIRQAIQKTRDYLLDRQHPEGYWVGELEADASVAAGYIPLMYWMTGTIDPARQQKAVNFALSKQNPDGSWSAFPGGPGNLDVSIQVYMALKLAGLSAGLLKMQQARRFVLSKGGIGKANAFTRIWLALFGQFDWRDTPSVPPEIIYLPNWFYFNIYEFASWSRETIMALAVVLSQKPVCRVPQGRGVEELYLEPAGKRHYPLGKTGRRLSWDNFFLRADALFKAWDRVPIRPGRKQALRKVAEWIVAHQEADGSWGGIMLPWIYSLIALKSLGYGPQHPVIVKGMKGLEDFIIEDETTLRLQPATSPVWDTAWVIHALLEAGLPGDHPALTRAARWLLQQEIRFPGDWKIKNPKTEPGGWAFEFANKFYPDLDDTPVVARALGSIRLDTAEEAAKQQAIERARRWVLSMQCRDGGWAAFDLNNDKQALVHVPFADFMSPLDPTCADVTAHAIEFLSGLDSHPPEEAIALRRGLRYLQDSQQADGSWYGRWGVNYVYGTGLALEGIQAAGTRMEQDFVQRAAGWLRAHQNPDGGWGETCQSYGDDPAERGRGPSTASQTAWGLFGLLAAGQPDDRPIQAGLRYLLDTQCADGSWTEPLYTGTGFPRAFYLHYDLYRIYFPLIALGRYANRAGGD